MNQRTRPKYVSHYRSIPIAARTGEDSIYECWGHGANGGTSHMIKVDAVNHLSQSLRVRP
jgi:hypothetical protein